MDFRPNHVQFYCQVGLILKLLSSGTRFEALVKGGGARFKSSCQVGFALKLLSSGACFEAL